MKCTPYVQVDLVRLHERLFVVPSCFNRIQPLLFDRLTGDPPWAGDLLVDASDWRSQVDVLQIFISFPVDLIVNHAGQRLASYEIRPAPHAWYIDETLS